MNYNISAECMPATRAWVLMIVKRFTMLCPCINKWSNIWTSNIWKTSDPGRLTGRPSSGFAILSTWLWNISGTRLCVNETGFTSGSTGFRSCAADFHHPVFRKKSSESFPDSFPDFPEQFVQQSECVFLDRKNLLKDSQDRNDVPWFLTGKHIRFHSSSGQESAVPFIMCKDSLTFGFRIKPNNS